MTPVIKYWNCKIAPSVVYEAMECLGGNGYVEEGNISRHYREAPLNAIWEGSGNVMCLDVLRVLSKDPKSLEITLSTCQDDLKHSGLADCPQIVQPLTDAIDWIRTASGEALENPASARVLTERLALLAAGTEMARLGLHTAAEPFIATRLSGQWRSTYGVVAEKYIDPILQMAYASQ
jgi:putative acyl-CoA dehydrogenase